MLKKFIHILFLLLSVSTFATHNRAGEITFTHVSGLTYEITITTYTKDSSPADRPSLGIFWGDNTPLDSIFRTSKILLGNDINQNIYIGQHTYPGANPSPYLISVEDPNRNEGSMNIPNSINIPFYLETELLINPFLGINNSPVLLNPPIDNACVGIPFIHNPGAVDSDGDSLSYSLQQSLGQGGLSIPNYQFPTASNSLTVNSVSGDLIWNSPLQVGEYNVAILIEEFRNGQKIGSVLRDIQITVAAGCPPPPDITGASDTCVVAGEILNFGVNATGSSAVTLSATGLPFIIPNPAVFQQTTAPSTITSGDFTWETNCSNVRNSAYSVSFKATSSGSIPLIDFLTTTITVIGPPPTNLVTGVQSNSIDLSWDLYPCSQITGYKIYRRQGPSGWVPDDCETGIPSSTGFQLIATTSSQIDTSFTDNNNGLGLIHGEDYCYRVVACYPDGAQSIASDEICAQLKKDVPIITNVSVNSTSQTTGSNYIAWSKPTEFDTIQFSGPYRYLIYRGQQSNTNLVLIDSTISINDTTFIDTLINTEDFQHFYRVDLYNVTTGSRDLIGKSTVASSIYISLTPSDNKITIVWNESVPWTNTEHVIYRQNLVTLDFDSIAITTNNTSYIDSNLVNGINYCYQVKSIGSYSTTSIINPIENYSQENCAIPIDNVDPCPPNLFVDANCNLFQNFLYWENESGSCSEDILEYKIYKKDFIDDNDYSLLTTIPNDINGPDTTFLDDNLSSIAGCYVITSVDSVGNESVFSDSICVDNCPIYTLPNVFTPGSDNINDLFIPFPYRFVESINIEIFNRWGQLVFETNDPDILWDGTNQNTNTKSTDGTYFYVCTVNEIFLDGIKPRIIKGFITLIANKGNTQP